jgi:radical SAM superfamily enzyme YgiQ (UPF0313 family)
MRKQQIDCLLVHVPGTMQGGGLSVLSMSMGLFALADMLNRNGFTARIIHLGLEQINNQGSTLEEYINNNDILLIGFSLHWHLQSYNTIREVNRIKSVRPEIKIVLGGFTAAFFADEIMKDFSAVDFIIKGDAEIPLIELTRALSKGRRTFACIPNLAWRRGRKIIINDIAYLADNSSLENLNFTNFDLLENFATYKKIGLTVAACSLKEELFSDYKKIFPLCVGRGCLVNCSFCGGSKLSQKLICNRHGIVFRSPEAVFESIKIARSAGYAGIYLDFDPWPRRTYFRKLFRLIRKSRISTALEFACWSLPDKDFINDLEKTFGENASLLISPDTGSDRLRKLNKGYFFTNKELIASLSLLKRKGIKAEIYFSYPLPFTTEKDIQQENSLIELLSRDFSDFHRIIRPALSFDPASPMFIYPDRYKIKKKINGFSDYYMPLKRTGYSLAGYNHKDFKKMFVKHKNAVIAGGRLLPEAKVCYEVKNFKQATKLAEQALRLNTQDAEIYSLLGACYEETARDQDALKLYSKALKMCPHARGIYLSLIKLYMKLKMYPMAIKTITKNNRINDDKDAGLYLLMGSCYTKLREYKNAVAAFRKAEKIKPDMVEISFYITKCYLQMEKEASAGKEISKGYYKLKNTAFVRDKVSVD